MKLKKYENFVNERKVITNKGMVEKLKTFFEAEDFQVHLFEQDNMQCAEVEKWTDGGVDMVIVLIPFSKEEFIEYVKDFDIDEEIDLHRQAKDYRAAFTITQSVEDFTNFHKDLEEVVEKISELF